MSQLTRFRQEVDSFFANTHESPLNRAEQAEFQGLNYYEPNNELLIEASIEYFSKDEPAIEMQTTTGEVRHYRRFATLKFEVSGTPAELVVYSDPWGESLFLPFKDATNGRETYGAGRYLDSHRPGLFKRGDSMLIDFNYAYNPYCAYQSNYSCPLPPRENWLAVPIRAGEMKYESPF